MKESTPVNERCSKLINQCRHTDSSLGLVLVIPVDSSRRLIFAELGSNSFSVALVRFTRQRTDPDESQPGN